MDLAGPYDDCSTVEQLVRAVVVLCCGASSVYNTDEDGHSNGVTSASRQREPLCLGAPAAEILEFFGIGEPPQVCRVPSSAGALALAFLSLA